MQSISLVSHIISKVTKTASTGIDYINKEEQLHKFKLKVVEEEEKIKNRQQTLIIENFLIKERGMQHLSEFNPL